MYEVENHEPESDAARWGLDIFEVDQLFSTDYSGGSKQHDSHYENEYSDDNNAYNNSHALDEELIQLSIAGASELSMPVEEYQESTDVHPDWHSPVRNYYIEHDPGLEEVGDGGASSSCSSPGDRSHDGDEYSCTLEITDEFDLDGEVGKRLNQLISVPHIPRINGDIPSFDEATSDHQRLLDRLQLYDLIEHKTKGDGNCQFRALSDQFYRTQEHHKFVRKQVVNQLKAHPEIYEGYVPMAYGDYLKRMDKSGEWGDHVTLQAAADSYGVKILVITSFKDTCYIEILPKDQKSKRVIHLSFWAEVHYNSIYPQREMPLPDMDTKKKKKWWNFRNKQ